MKNYIKLLFVFIFLNGMAQVGIGTTTPQGALDIQSNNSGFLVPRISLNSTVDAATVINPSGSPLAEGTLIYNVSTAGTGSTAVVPGFYYWNSSQWMPIRGNSGWSLNGNAGTTATNYLGTSDAQPVHFATNGVQRMSISYDADPYFDGSIIINPTLFPNNPYRFAVLEDIQDKFAIYSGITNTTSQAVCIETGHANTSGGSGILSNGFYGIIAFGYDTSGLFIGNVNMTNDLTVSGTIFNPSDKRIKSNIKDINHALAKIRLLKPYSYEKNLNLIDQTPKNVILKKEQLEAVNQETEPIVEFGLIAQELELIFPELVKTTQTAIKNDNSSPLKSVNYMGLIPILIKGMQEQQAQIEELKQENAAMKEKMDTILSILEK